MSGSETRGPKLEEEVARENLDIQKILKKINRSEKGSPHLEIISRAVEQLSELTERCRGDGRKIIAIIRCWDKSKNDLREVVSRLEKMKMFLPELEGAIFAIDGDHDLGQKTDTNLEAVVEKEKPSVAAVPIRINNYSWTAGFNGPAALLSETAKEQKISEENIFIFPLSFDVEFNEEELRALAEKFRKTGFVATAKQTSGEILNEEKKIDLSFLTTDLISHPEKLIGKNLRGRENFNKLVTLARNTATIVPLSEITRMGGYDNSTNEIGGMEDHDLYVRILIEVLRESKISEKTGDLPDEEKKKIMRAREKVRNLLESLRHPVTYSDLAWNKLKVSAKKEKIKREMSALRIITERITALAENSDSDKYKTPEQNRDFNF
jgi:hypothetical protein